MSRSPTFQIRVLIVFILALLALSCAHPTIPSADLLIHNARVYTLDAARPWSEAVVVRGERILYVGSSVEAKKFQGDETRVIDAGGRMLLPGFIDSHNHIQYGFESNQVHLHEATSLAETQAMVSAFARERPELEWIVGGGWNYLSERPDRLPTAADLVGLTAGRPTLLMAYDYHTAWLNESAMEQAGMLGNSPTIDSPHIVRDPKTGQPTGVVKGVASLGDANPVMERLWQLVPFDEAAAYRDLNIGLDTALSFGITTIVEPQVDFKNLYLFEILADEERSRPRLQLAIFHPPGTSPEDLAAFTAARKQFDDDHVRVAAIKLYIDDVIEAHTAALLEPYSDLPGERGETFYSPEAFNDTVTKLDRMNFQIFIHAIGDRGIRTALDAIESARQRNGIRDSRHQLVHVEIVSSSDAPRFKELGVVACMQPRHLMPELPSDTYEKALGPERIQRILPWRSLQKAGATLAFSSDWNVAEMEPLIGIYTAITRRGLDGTPADGVNPEEAVDLASAIRAYTLGGAYANFVEDDRGSIEVGKYADLVLLSNDLFAIHPDEILNTQVDLTIVGGRIAYGTEAR